MSSTWEGIKKDLTEAKHDLNDKKVDAAHAPEKARIEGSTDSDLTKGIKKQFVDAKAGAEKLRDRLS
jgi:hypothetical protein